MTVPFQPFDDVTISALRATMVAALVKHGPHTPFAPGMPNEKKLVILVEEVGEVARALTYDEGGNRDALVKELLQTAAMALSWAQCVDQMAEYAVPEKSRKIWAEK
jgi:hypothetical protein